MKQVYDSLPLAPGAHHGGIFKVLVTPKEVLAADPVINFATGAVTTALTLLGGFSWYEFQFTPESYTYEETPKAGREGNFFEISIKGIINTNTAYYQQVLNTLRYCELVALVTDREKNTKVVGNTARGMLMQYSPNTNNASPGLKTIQVTLTYQTEESAPYYVV